MNLLFLPLLVVLTIGYPVVIIEDYGGSLQPPGTPFVVTLAGPCLINTIHVCTNTVDNTVDINNCEAEFLTHTWVDTQHYTLMPGWQVSIDTNVLLGFWDPSQTDVIVNALLANDTDVGYTHIVRVNPISGPPPSVRLPIEHKHDEQNVPKVPTLLNGSGMGVIIGTGIIGTCIACITVAIVIVRSRQEKRRNIIHIDSDNDSQENREEDFQRLLRMGRGVSPAFMSNLPL